MKNNPFKMWGSWVGAIIYTIPYLLIVGGFCSGWNCLGFVLPYLPLALLIPLVGSPFINPGSWLIIPLFGFLIGWGIQTLIRKIR